MAFSGIVTVAGSVTKSGLSLLSDTVRPPAGAGALVTQVASGGPAEQAGLQPGDVVTAVNGRQIGGPSDIAATIDSQLVGSEVLLQIDRGGQLQTIGVTLAARPAGAP